MSHKSEQDIEIQSLSLVPEAQDLIEMVPVAVSLNSVSGSRPVLILKDKDDKNVLAVWMTQLDAGVALINTGFTALADSPHFGTHKIFETFNMKISRCIFQEIVGHHQFVELVVSQEEAIKLVRVRADKVMSLCLSLKVPFFASKEFIANSKLVALEMEGVAQGMDLVGQKPEKIKRWLN